MMAGSSSLSHAGIVAATALLFSTLIIPASTTPVAGAVPDPLITPSPSLNEPSRTRLEGRDFFDDIQSGVGSILNDLGSAIPSFVASGIPNFFQGFPDGTEVLDQLGITNGDIDAQPTQVLNLPPYANWTKDGWNVRFHGNVYKQPRIERDKLNDLANIFLVDVDIQDLPPSQQDQARNLTAEIFIVQQGNVPVTVMVEPKGVTSGDVADGAQIIKLPYNTTDQGDFDVFVGINDVSGSGITNGDQAKQVQELAVYARGAKLGNATAYLVPPQGLTVVSDIDDILRVTKIYEPSKGLLNSFARPFRPWMNMPDIYASWQKQYPAAHFHYLTTTPEQVTRNYMEYIFGNYPLGSFDTRPLNFSNVDATLSIRKFLLTKVLETFPNRKFALVADTSNSDVMKDYPLMAKTYPDRVACILLRNTSATDSGDLFPYDTSGFKGLNAQSYMFFRTPDDLVGLDIANGQCVNKTFAQNVTFDWQGLPGAAGLGYETRLTWAATAALMTVALAFMMG
jgi:phosphatidate phosphatase APP1